jgi:hypothetical protein
MQVTTQAAPEAPAAPATPRPTAITTVGADGNAQTISVPKTQAEVDALVRQREEISDQLINVNERRQELVQQIRSAPDGVARTGLEDRVKILDQRLIQLESDLAVTGRQLAAAPAELVSSSQREPRPSNSGSGSDWDEGFALGSFLSVSAIALIYAFRRWRGRKKPRTRGAMRDLPSDSAQRLQRLEQGMEAIAIEIERVSEGQRFVTKLLSEAPQPVGMNSRIGQADAVERA